MPGNRKSSEFTLVVNTFKALFGCKILLGTFGQMVEYN